MFIGDLEVHFKVNGLCCLSLDAYSPNRLTQCCTQFKDSLCVAFALECGIHIWMIWKFLKQNVLFPKGLNKVQHWVSRLGLFRCQSSLLYLWGDSLWSIFNACISRHAWFDFEIKSSLNKWKFKTWATQKKKGQLNEWINYSKVTFY